MNMNAKCLPAARWFAALLPVLQPDLPAAPEMPAEALRLVALEVLAGLWLGGLARVALLEHLQASALTDGLTGVANRRAFDAALERELSLAARTGAVNLGQGFPDTDGPREMLEAAKAAIDGGRNQYPPGPGVPELLEAVARRDGSDRPIVGAQTRALYRLIDALRERHPSLEIESCSAGGARIDLGILSRTDVQTMRDAGVHAFLVGEAFMRAPEPGLALAELFA